MGIHGIGAKVMPLLLNSKMTKLSKHPDIAVEFEYWITEKQYKEENCVVVEGYSARKLSEMSVYLDGEGAFMLLIELRDNPESALEKISNGFRMKWEEDCHESKMS